jgi:translation initiation factor IF-2
MNDTTDNKDKTGGSRPGGTLTLKRPAVEQSRVKQSFSHGRTKTVVVETKRKRFGDDKPAAAPEAKPAFQQQPRVAPQHSTQVAPPPSTQRPATPQPSRSGVVLRTLTSDEREARDRALADARLREAEERKRQEEELVRRKAQEERDRIEREAAAKRKADDDARHQAEEQGRRKAEEAAKKLSPKTPSRDEEDEDEGSRRRPASGGPRPSAVRPASVAAKVVSKPAAVPTRTKADIAKKEMRGRLTVSNAMDEDETSRGRSVAAFERDGFQCRRKRCHSRSHHHPGTVQPHGRARRRRHQVS